MKIAQCLIEPSIHPLAEGWPMVKLGQSGSLTHKTNEAGRSSCRKPFAVRAAIVVMTKHHASQCTAGYQYGYTAAASLTDWNESAGE